VEAIVLLAVIALILLVFLGYLFAVARFMRRHPPSGSSSQRYDMGNSITGFWRYVLREHKATTRGKRPGK
jgi:hypothetical protein